MFKKLFLSSLVCLLLLYCRSARDTMVSKKEFIGAFKMFTFCSCMENSNSKKYHLSAEDVSCRFPDYMINQFKIIDSLGKQEASRIRQDSVERIGRVGEGMEGKIIIYNCMEFMKSDVLLKVAKSQFRIELKIAKQ